MAGHTELTHQEHIQRRIERAGHFISDGHATSLGAASGVVAGLVAITPACGALTPVTSIILGVVAGGLSAVAVGLKYRFGYDDSLDVVGVHLVAGLWGTIGAGLLATGTGLFLGGGWQQTALQVIIALISVVWSLVLTFVIGWALKVTLGWRVSEDAESEGIDQVVHAETGYELGGFPASTGRSATARPVATASQVEGANA